MAILTINNVDMPSPSELHINIFDVGDFSRRDMAGDAVADRLALKRELSLTWARLSGAQLATLLGAINAGVFFTATYPDPATGEARAGDFRAVSRTAEARRAADGEICWANVEITLEEK